MYLKYRYWFSNFFIFNTYKNSDKNNIFPEYNNDRNIIIDDVFMFLSDCNTTQPDWNSIMS